MKMLTVNKISSRKQYNSRRIASYFRKITAIDILINTGLWEILLNNCRLLALFTKFVGLTPCPIYFSKYHGANFAHFRHNE